MHRLTTGWTDPATLRWSPDGRHLAFCDYNFNVWVLRDVNISKPASFSTKVKVGSGLASSNEFSWSPDSAYLVYSSGGDPYRVAADGTGTERLSNSPEDDRNPD